MSMAKQDLKRKRGSEGDAAADQSKKQKTEPTHLVVDQQFKHDVLTILEKKGWKVQGLPKKGEEGLGSNQSRAFLNTKVNAETSYSRKRIKEVCRWISTAVYVRLMTDGSPVPPEEVQATVWPPDDPKTASFYVSANKKPALERMNEWFGAGTARNVLEDITEWIGNNESDFTVIGKLKIGPRALLHPRLLRKWLEDQKPKKDPADPAWSILLEALSRHAVVASGKARPGIDTHAEIRLHETIEAKEKAVDPAREVTFDPRNVGGLKRPCVFCYLALYAEKNRDDVHPGLLWVSKNAAEIHVGRFGKTPEEVADYIMARVTNTYISPGPFPEYYGYDSDSSADEAVQNERARIRAEVIRARKEANKKKQKNKDPANKKKTTSKPRKAAFTKEAKIR